MASKDIAAHPCFPSVSRDLTDSIRKFVDKSAIKFARGVKLETKNGKTEDRILVITTWRLYLMAWKVPTKVEATFNFLEIRAMNTHPELQSKLEEKPNPKVVIETDKSTYSLRLQSRDHRDHVINHINFALSRIFNNSVFAPSLCHSDSDLSDGSRKYSPSSDTSVETQRACGGFSETYAALCDYNGISCKEEVQWVSWNFNIMNFCAYDECKDVDTIYHSQDNREFNLLDFSHLESRDLAVIVASMAYNTWFTKLYCKDMRIVTILRFTLSCKTPQCMLKGPEANRTTSSAKISDEILWSPNRTPSSPWLRLEILSIKTMNRTGDKGQPCRSPTCTGNRSDLQLAMRTKLLLRLYRDRTALNRGPRTPYSQSTSHRMPRGTRSKAFSKSTKHMWTGWANSHEPSSTLWRV
ncbi:hypothetical protein QTP70_028364 [Hemibagrus guttatus]|uniref:CARMIL pleckstrin homology domain-containing protein n=1 Tax=Hemibagrus guttatus TaxID=175788 RepID=A0AAE0UI21_9TELE|nr:hypothetical protein QTP70_028364 [Hemibagrus guttatus]